MTGCTTYHNDPASTVLRRAWSGFLDRYKWTCFGTHTWSMAQRNSEKMVQHFNTWLFRWQLGEALHRGLCSMQKVPCLDGYGRTVFERTKIRGPWWNAYRKSRGKPVYVLGVEEHRNGSLHLHSLIREGSTLPDMRRTEAWRLWTGRGEGDDELGLGRSRFEPPGLNMSVSEYVAKYVTKGGLIVLSDTFDAPAMPAATAAAKSSVEQRWTTWEPSSATRDCGFG